MSTAFMAFTALLAMVIFYNFYLNNIWKIKRNPSFETRISFYLFEAAFSLFFKFLFMPLYSMVIKPNSR